MGLAPDVGQPFPLVRGPWPVSDRKHGMDVIDFRPERAAAAAEHMRELVERLRSDARQRAHGGGWEPQPRVEPSAVWVERVDERIPRNARELGTEARRAGWRVLYSFAEHGETRSLCVWFARGRERARMTYLNGGADRAVAWGPDTMIRTLSVTQLRAWMDGQRNADSG